MFARTIPLPKDIVAPDDAFKKAISPKLELTTTSRSPSLLISETAPPVIPVIPVYVKSTLVPKLKDVAFAADKLG